VSGQNKARPLDREDTKFTNFQDSLLVFYQVALRNMSGDRRPHSYRTGSLKSHPGAHVIDGLVRLSQSGRFGGEKNILRVPVRAWKYLNKVIVCLERFIRPINRHPNSGKSGKKGRHTTVLFQTLATDTKYPWPVAHH
jgi:hypothetical protein